MNKALTSGSPKSNHMFSRFVYFCVDVLLFSTAKGEYYRKLIKVPARCANVVFESFHTSYILQLLTEARKIVEEQLQFVALSPTTSDMLVQLNIRATLTMHFVDS